MCSSDLQQGVTIPAEKFRAPIDVPKIPPLEAIEFFRRKVPLDSKTIERLVRMARERGMAVREGLTQQLRDLMEEIIGEALAQGRGLKWFTDNVQTILRRSGLDPANPFRLETVFRTNLSTAYNAGRQEQMEDPDVAAVFTHWQFDAVLDGATTDVCRAMHGKVFPKDHPVWDTHMPPNHFNCRSSVIPVSQLDIDDEGLTISRAVPDAKPDAGFRRNHARALRRNPETGL